MKLPYHVYIWRLKDGELYRSTSKTAPAEGATLAFEVPVVHVDGYTGEDLFRAAMTGATAVGLPAVILGLVALLLTHAH